MTQPNGLKRYLVATASSITTALLLQTGVLLWWSGTMSARMDNAEKDIERVEVRVTYLEQDK